MNIIIPMAGAGQRFSDAGYMVHKPLIPTTDRRSGKSYPMVVCAAVDLPGVEPEGGNITFIDRSFHKADGLEQKIAGYFPKASFLTLGHLTEGQACTCLAAKEKINGKDGLLIAGCDNGMSYNEPMFWKLTQQCDVLVFTYRHSHTVLKNPDAYGWMYTDKENRITGLSIKKAISDMPMQDHAIVSTFWFRQGSYFVEAAEKMISENDRINGEFYVDETIRHAMDLGMDARIFEIDRYLGWGTPNDYEEYMATMQYWKEFVFSEKFLPEKTGNGNQK